jgi:hypothetical protein
VTGLEFLGAFLLGFLLGTWMSWRKILRARRRAERTQGQIAQALGAKLYETLKDVDIIKISVTEDGKEELKVDQDKLDVFLGNKTEH